MECLLLLYVRCFGMLYYGVQVEYLTFTLLKLILYFHRNCSWRLFLVHLKLHCISWLYKPRAEITSDWWFNPFFFLYVISLTFFFVLKKISLSFISPSAICTTFITVICTLRFSVYFSGVPTRVWSSLRWRLSLVHLYHQEIQQAYHWVRFCLLYSLRGVSRKMESISSNFVSFQLRISEWARHHIFIEDY